MCRVPSYPENPHQVTSHALSILCSPVFQVTSHSGQLAPVFVIVFSRISSSSLLPFLLPSSLSSYSYHLLLYTLHPSPSPIPPPYSTLPSPPSIPLLPQPLPTPAPLPLLTPFPSTPSYLLLSSLSPFLLASSHPPSSLLPYPPSLLLRFMPFSSLVGPITLVRSPPRLIRSITSDSCSCCTSILHHQFDPATPTCHWSLIHVDGCMVSGGEQ